MSATELLAQVAARAPHDLIPPYTLRQQADVRCILCDEVLVPACGGDPQRQVCEWCLRDYQRQVLDRSPALRQHALALFEAVLAAGRTLTAESVRAQNFAAWALYRLGIDIGRRRVMLLDTTADSQRVRVRITYGHSVERGLMAQLARQIEMDNVLLTATVKWSAWPELVAFAAEWGLAIRLPYTGRAPHFVTDHLVGDAVPDLAAVFAGPRRAVLERVDDATLTLLLESGGDDAAHALLFDPRDGSCAYKEGRVAVSKYRRLVAPDEWITPAVELCLHLSALGFDCPALPVCGHLGALRTELKVELGESVRDLQHALAHLGLVDTCQTQPSYLGYSRRHGEVVHVVLEAGTDALLVERGRVASRIDRVSNRQALSSLRKHL